MKPVLLATDYFNMHANLNMPSTIVCNISDYQLGSYILQYGRPIVYWSNKFLSPAQKKYTITEKELLAIVLAASW